MYLVGPVRLGRLISACRHDGITPVKSIRYWHEPVTPALLPAAMSAVSIFVIGFSLFVFGLVAERARRELSAFDRSIMISLRDPIDPSRPIGPAWLREIARDITSLGSTVVLGLIVITAIAYQLLLGQVAWAVLLALAVVGGIALNNCLKFVFARPRPRFVSHTTRLYTTSFPSGHATLAAIAYLTLAALLAQSHHSSVFGGCMIVLATVVTVMVGLSRVYLGVHYPSDILAGWCIGVAWALMCWATVIWLHLPNADKPSSFLGGTQRAYDIIVLAYTAPTIKLALIPPKANEFDSA
jgi:undecaprenyl-diphosphatase